MVEDSEFGSRLLDYLPAIYQRAAQTGTFLSAFESTLFGSGSGEESDAGRPAQKSLQRLIEDIPALFDPEEAPSEFLPWLAQWAAVTLHEGIPESRRRRLIYQMIPLYSIRGTKAYLTRVLQLYTGAKAAIEEDDLPGMQVGIRSTVGHDSRLGQDPFQFHVFLDLLSVPDAHGHLPGVLELANMVINMAKPAHTHYKLVHNLKGADRGLVINVRSTVGINTLLWHDS